LRHFDAVHAYLARRVGAIRADDLASATFTIAFERRRTFRDATSSARPWLLGIATNLVRNEWRAEQRALEAVVRLGSEAGTIAGVQGAGCESEAGRAAGLLEELDSDQREVVLLHAWEGLSYQEIAAALGIPLGTVRSRLARARARLRSGLSGSSPEVERQEMEK